MQTIDSYVVDSRANLRRTSRRGWAILAFAPMAFGVTLASAVALLGHAGNQPTVAAHVKRDARIAEVATPTSPADEARLAAFQQSVAISQVTPAAFAPSQDAPPAIVSKPAPQPPRKPEPKPVARSAAIMPPLPQARPEAAVAEPPAAPPVEAGRGGGVPAFVGKIARQVESVPRQAHEFASGATDRVFDAISYMRDKVGL